MYLEDRKTFQCHPSARTIGKAVGLTENTVRKYIRRLEDKGLIYTEHTKVRPRNGPPRNGNLLFTVRPKMYNDVREHGRTRKEQKDKTPGLSSSYVRGIHTMLHNCLSRAEKEKL